MTKILLVEDNESLAEAVVEALGARGYVVDHVANGVDALDRLLHYHYDLAILDWMLPGMTGLEVCTRYRASGGQVLILMLTGKEKISEKEEAFDSGADEYLTKPFHTRELLVRIRALLRRPPNLTDQITEIGYLRINITNRSVMKQEELVDLTASEYAMLELFVKNKGKIFSFAELLERVFNTDEMASDEAVRQRVMRLRKKIDIDGQDSLIKTIKGLGYKLEV
jgi:DNA-binding response OmpR family regulator